MPRYVGAFHVHSAFSDGNLSLEQLANVARAQQLDFVVCADHAPYLEADQVAALVQKCAELSDEALLLVPGLEFELEGRHVVALGPGALLGELEAGTVVGAPETVRARGGFTVWAHPAVTFAWTLGRPLQLAYDAWEVWNRRADGSSPCLPVLRALWKARRRGRPVLALAGTDFHKGDMIPGPFVVVEGPPELTVSAVLEALREGQYQIQGSGGGGSGAINARGEGEQPSLPIRLFSVARYALQRVHCVLALARYRCLAGLWFG
ncbi:MAG: hypothetical protein WCP21_00045 [Armatimonadota bacterium]